MSYEFEFAVCSYNNSGIKLEGMPYAEVDNSEDPDEFLYFIVPYADVRVSTIVTRPESSVKTIDSQSGINMPSRYPQVLPCIIREYI